MIFYQLLNALLIKFVKVIIVSTYSVLESLTGKILYLCDYVMVLDTKCCINYVRLQSILCARGLCFSL